MQVEALVGGYNLTEAQMRQIMQVMESEMSLGLSRKSEDRKKSSLQMENTFVHQTIDGTGKLREFSLVKQQLFLFWETTQKKVAMWTRLERISTGIEY